MKRRPPRSTRTDTLCPYTTLFRSIPAEAIPYDTCSGLTYDSGDFPALLEHAVKFADWDGFEARRAESRARGRLRGRGIGDYLEVTAPPQNEMGGIRFEADGSVTVITGTLDYGQGHWTPFAQVLHARLGVPFEKIRLLQGDSDELIAGGGTGGSKSIMASGAAIVEASDKVIEAGKRIAGHLLEAAVPDIEFRAGRFSIAGTDRSIGIMEIAERLRAGAELPDDVPHSLNVKHVHAGAPSAFPNGCHVAEVEVDPDTGVVEVVRYHMVNDFGTVVNPMLVEGQAHGGVVQGIGQALMERCAWDGDGQVQTGSYMNYAVPRATDAPFFALEAHSVPATSNLLGAKGCGEARSAEHTPEIHALLFHARARFRSGRYHMVKDVGSGVNPMLCGCQADCGVVQGIGQARMGRCAWDGDGQVQTGSYMDYAVPRVTDAPFFALEAHSVPATSNLLGAKGCGEAGCAGSLPSVMNAVVDALSEYGIRHIDMPATPERVWQAIRQARG